MLESGALWTKWKDALVYHRPNFTSSLTLPLSVFPQMVTAPRITCCRSAWILTVKEVQFTWPSLERQRYTSPLLLLCHTLPSHPFICLHLQSVSSQSCCEDSDRTVLNIVSLSLLKGMDSFEIWFNVRAGRSYRFPDLIWHLTHKLSVWFKLIGFIWYTIDQTLGVSKILKQYIYVYFASMQLTMKTE